jgi:hypothetical protein
LQGRLRQSEDFDPHAALEAPEKRKALRQEPIFTSPGP